MEQAQEREFEHVKEPYGILPYGGGSFQWDTLAQLAYRIRREGMWEVVFHEEPNLPIEQVLGFFASGVFDLQILMEVKEGKMQDVAGLAWLSDKRTCQGGLQKAVGSFVYFKDYQSPKWTGPLGRMVLSYWFEQLGLNTLIGITPEANRAALLYIKRLGLEEIGRIPEYTIYGGRVVSAVITAMTRGRYYNTAFSLEVQDG